MEILETQRRIWRKWHNCPFLPGDPVNLEIPIDYTPSEWQYSETLEDSWWHDECMGKDSVRRRFWRPPEKNEIVVGEK